MILKLFSSGNEHPLADARELRRVLDELPPDNAFKAIDEIVGWLESLENAEGVRIDKVFDIVRQLDDAAQPHIRRLTRDYLNMPRMARNEERQSWTTALDFWWHLTNLYSRSLAAGAHRDRAVDSLKAQLPLITVRLFGALGACLKWVDFKYAPVPKGYWKRLGEAHMIAEQGKFAGKSVQPYPGVTGVSSPTQELLKALVLAASSLDTLQPVEVELAEKLITHFLPHFVFSDQDRPDNLYWIDLAEDRPPQRLARIPLPSPTLRFISPVQAATGVAEMIRIVERGEVPTDLALGGQYPVRLVLTVLRHIASYWASTPPLRKSQRHAVNSQLSVLHGLESCTAVFNGAGDGAAEHAENWVAENVSMGGFGACVRPHRNDWLQIGTLLCLQPEGGENWVLGVVRRYGRASDLHAGVGVETLARSAHTITMRPQGTLSYGSDEGIKGILFRESMDSDEVGIVLPINSFDGRESLDAMVDGRLTRLVPAELVETGPDYEIARYRQRFAD